MRYFKHLNLKLIARTIGIMLWVVGGLMLIPACFCFIVGETNESIAFLLSLIICFLAGFILRNGIGRNTKHTVRKNEGFLIVGFSWIIVPIFGALPFFLSGALPDFSNAFFESMSGFTTTGSTVFGNIEAQAKGILLWRGLSQWLGGGGLVLFTIIVLKYIREDLQHLYTAEITGPLKDKVQPKIVHMMRQYWGVYSLLTILLFIALLFGEMNAFDAICHAMSTVSTGGFSTFNNGLINTSHYTQNIIAVFMFFSGINFALLYFFFTGKPLKLLQDEQFKWYVRIILFFIPIVFLFLVFHSSSSIFDSLQKSTFTVISIASTTGYNIYSHTAFGAFIPISLFFLMLVGGCSGSASGGIKVSRIILLLKYIISKFRTQLHPRAIIPVKYNTKVIRPHIINQVFAFFFLYFLFLMSGGFLLTFSGHTIQEALSLSAASLGNIGPVVSDLCPSCSYSHLSFFGKWVLSVLMLAGRLELLALVAIFSPSFWKS